jgi:hypothetical protein
VRHIVSIVPHPFEADVSDDAVLEVPDGVSVGSRNVWTWPEARPTLMSGSLG